MNNSFVTQFLKDTKFDGSSFDRLIVRGYIRQYARMNRCFMISRYLTKRETELSHRI